jgi:hypothetical protein
MSRLLKRVLLSVLGMVITLVWWSIRPGHDNHSSVDHIPASVWDGGGGVLTIETDASCPAILRVSFYESEKEYGEGRQLETWEKIPAGARTWTIQVPPGAGGTVELNAESPKVGDRLQYTLKVNGEVVDEQSESLDEELESGYAFAVQTEFDDYGKAQLSEN